MALRNEPRHPVHIPEHPRAGERAPRMSNAHAASSRPPVRTRGERMLAAADAPAMPARVVSTPLENLRLTTPPRAAAAPGRRGSSRALPPGSPGRRPRSVRRSGWPPRGGARSARRGGPRRPSHPRRRWSRGASAPTRRTAGLRAAATDRLCPPGLAQRRPAFADGEEQLGVDAAAGGLGVPIHRKLPFTGLLRTPPTGCQAAG